MSRKNRERKFGSDEAAAGGSEMSKLYWILGAVAVLGVGIVAYSVGSNAMGNTATQPVEVEGLDDPARLVELARGVVKGDPDAPVTIIEFGDYQCPGCALFARQVEPMVDAEFVESGRAKFIFYDFPLTGLHPNAFLGARASRCAEDQDRYWDYHAYLFRYQPQWSVQQNPTGTLVDYAGTLGLDADAFESCLRSDRHADVVSANMELGNQLLVQGTPTVMVSQGQGMARRVATNGIEGIREAVEMIQGGG